MALPGSSGRHRAPGPAAGGAAHQLLLWGRQGFKNQKWFCSVFAGCRKAGVPEPICAGPAPAVQCTAITFLLPCALSSPGSSRASAGFPFHS